jgi:hypothetical protein
MQTPAPYILAVIVGLAWGIWDRPDFWTFFAGMFVGFWLGVILSEF